MTRAILSSESSYWLSWLAFTRGSSVVEAQNSARSAGFIDSVLYPRAGQEGIVASAMPAISDYGVPVQIGTREFTVSSGPLRRCKACNTVELTVNPLSVPLGVRSQAAQGW